LINIKKEQKIEMCNVQSKQLYSLYKAHTHTKHTQATEICTIFRMAATVSHLFVNSEWNSQKKSRET